MRIVNLGDTNSILNKFVAELRDVDIQKDSLRFRRNVFFFKQKTAYEIGVRLVGSEYTGGVLTRSLPVWLFVFQSTQRNSWPLCAAVTDGIV